MLTLSILAFAWKPQRPNPSGNGFRQQSESMDASYLVFHSFCSVEYRCLVGLETFSPSAEELKALQSHTPSEFEPVAHRVRCPNDCV